MAVHVCFLLILTGLTGIHSITTVREVSVKAGGSISIPCFYESQYTNHVKYLCKGSHWVSCSPKVKTNQQSSSEKFSISDDKSRRIFTVTINDVTDEDDDYWCVVEIDNDSDHKKYFHLSVTRDTPGLYVDHQEVTGTKGGNITISCHYSNPGEMKWCKLGSFCLNWPSGSIDGTPVNINTCVPNVFTVTMSGLRSSGWYYCAKGDLQMPVHITLNNQPTTKPTAEGGLLSPAEHLKSFSIRLSVLLFVVMAALFIWFIVKRYKQTRDKSSDTTTAEGEVGYMRNTSGEVTMDL